MVVIVAVVVVVAVRFEVDITKSATVVKRSCRAHPNRDIPTSPLQLHLEILSSAFNISSIASATIQTTTSSFIFLQLDLSRTRRSSGHFTCCSSRPAPSAPLFYNLSPALLHVLHVLHVLPLATSRPPHLSFFSSAHTPASLH